MLKFTISIIYWKLKYIREFKIYRLRKSILDIYKFIYILYYDSTSSNDCNVSNNNLIYFIYHAFLFILLSQTRSKYSIKRN